MTDAALRTEIRAEREHGGDYKSLSAKLRSPRLIKGFLTLLLFRVGNFDIVEHGQRFSIHPEADHIFCQFDTQPTSKPVLKIR